MMAGVGLSALEMGLAGEFFYQREGESQQYFDLFSPRGYAIGVNVVLYAMTH